MLSPVQKLDKFIEEVLLKNIEGNIIVFIDEIDTTLQLTFRDDFFALIRACYNQRVDNPDYYRLTFAMLGVATPADLMEHGSRTPFNIGTGIDLKGFEMGEAEPLAKGLAGKAEDSQAVLLEILKWTGGQPFLTQRVCRLVMQSSVSLTAGREAELIEGLVRSQVIERWQAQDEQKHLQTIRDRLLQSEKRKGRLLGLYQEICQRGAIPADESPEQIELRLSGLVVKRNGNLTVYNPIYAAVFDQNWIAGVLAELRPYGEALVFWLDSECEDESRLLRGKALEDAKTWAAQKNLTPDDYRFLDASQAFDSRESEKELEAERVKKDLEAAEKAKQVLEKAQRQAQRRIGIGSVILVISLILATIASLYAAKRVEKTEAEAASARAKLEVTELALNAVNKFPSQQLEALLLAMQAGQKLKDLRESETSESSAKDYPIRSTILVLARILQDIREWNQLKDHQGAVNSVNFSPDGEFLATCGEDGTIRIWNLNGKLQKQWQANSGNLLSIFFDAKGDSIISISEKGTAQLWSLTGKQQAKWQFNQETITTFGFNAARQLIATGDEQGMLRIWNFQGQKKAEWQAHQSRVTSLGFSPQNQLIATGDKDGFFNIWNLDGQNQGRTNLGSKLTSIVFSSDGKQIAIGANGRKINLYNLEDLKMESFDARQSKITHLSFSYVNNSVLLASVGVVENGADREWSVWIWKIAQFGFPGIELSRHKSEVYSLDFKPDSPLIVATGEENGMVKLWKPIKPELQSTSELESVESLLIQGCNWLESYLSTYPQVRKELNICK